MHPGAPEDLQARDEAGAQAGAHRGVCGCSQGGLHQVQDQPKEGQEACCQEVVLHPHRGVRPCLSPFIKYQPKEGQEACCQEVVLHPH